MPASTLIILSKSPASGRWIPWWGLVFGQLALGASWLLLVIVATREDPGAHWIELGWLHLVALGWITMIVLSILIHVIPAFTDAAWRFENVARRSLAVYAAGVLLLVTGFCLRFAAVLPWGGALIGLGLVGYLIPAGCTLATALRFGKTEAATARALGITLGSLAATATLGITFTWALDGRLPPGVLMLAPAHAELGIFGWLTILVIGVSVKTIGPITGSRSRVKWRHIAAGGSVFGGTLMLAAGSMLLVTPLMWAGSAALACGAVLYIVDVGVVLRRSSVPHRAPQAFIAAALTWLGVSLVLGGGALAGLPYAKAYVFVILVGWMGQMVNAHMHHIGVRLLITMFRGDEDETRPSRVLCAPLSWSVFTLSQISVASVAVALLGGFQALLLLGAAAGFIAWSATVANAAYAVRQLRYGAMQSRP